LGKRQWQVKQRVILPAHLGYRAVTGLKIDFESLVTGLVILSGPRYPNMQDAV
jgi:hypothetical protein